MHVRLGIPSAHSCHVIMSKQEIPLRLFQKPQDLEWVEGKAQQHVEFGRGAAQEPSLSRNKSHKDLSIPRGHSICHLIRRQARSGKGCSIFLPQEVLTYLPLYGCMSPPYITSPAGYHRIWLL